jgi:RNA polymerase sigma-70 factor (ECF subfamily)
MSHGQGPRLDRAGLQALHARLEERLYNVAYRWVWNAPEADDIVQETFARLWEKRERVRLETLDALAFRIAVSLAAKKRRSRRFWRWVSLDAASTTHAVAPLPDVALHAHAARTQLRAAIESLPERLRAVLVLCELSELSYQQVAEVLGIPVGTVGSRRNTALRELNTLLRAKEDSHV